MLTLLSLSGVVSYFVALHYANEVYDAWLYDSVNSLALAVEPGGDRGTVLDLTGTAESLFEWDVADSTYFKVTSSKTGYVAGQRDFPIIPENATTYRHGHLFDAAIDGAPVRVASLEVPGPQAGESVVLQVAETMHKRHELANHILLSALAPQLLLVAVAVAAIWFGVTRGLRPLLALATSIGEQTLRSPRPIPDDGVPIEARPLTRALNELLVRLNGAIAVQRQFVADAAHQLRSPLAALKLHVDEALHEDLPANARAVMERLRVSTDRASRLSHQLLSLARAEPEAAKSQPLEPVDIASLAQETGAEWVPRALKKGIDLGFAADEGRVEIVGNSLLLREAISNLLDNAVKYHPGNGRITLSVAKEREICLAVEDDGEGIPVDQRPRVVQRFCRGDRKAGDGSGLGLAIVSQIVLLHRGSLALLDATDGRGLRAELRFPAPT